MDGRVNICKRYADFCLIYVNLDLFPQAPRGATSVFICGYFRARQIRK